MGRSKGVTPGVTCMSLVASAVPPPPSPPPSPSKPSVLCWARSEARQGHSTESRGTAPSPRSSLGTGSGHFILQAMPGRTRRGLPAGREGVVAGLREGVQWQYHLSGELKGGWGEPA